MSELKLKLSKAGAKKGLAMAVAFTTALTSMGMGNMTAFAGQIPQLGEETGGEQTNDEETRSEEDSEEPEETPEVQIDGTVLGRGTHGRIAIAIDEGMELHPTDVRYGNVYEFGIHAWDLDYTHYEEGNYTGDGYIGDYWNDEYWTFIWYEINEDGEDEVVTDDIEDTAWGDYGLIVVADDAETHQYYVEAYYDDGQGNIDAVTTEANPFVLSIDSADVNINSNDTYNNIMRGESAELVTEVNSDIADLTVSYTWQKKTGDGDEDWTMITSGEATLEDGHVALTYNTPALYVDERGTSKEYRTLVSYHYNDAVNNDYESLKANHYVNVSTDGINVYNDQYIYFIKPGQKVTLTAEATIQREDTPIYGIWYKDGLPVKLDGKGDSTKPIEASYTATEAGTYEFRALSGRDECCASMKVVSLDDAETVDYNSVTNAFSIEASSTTGGESDYLYVIEPEYCTEYTMAVTASLENAAAIVENLSDNNNCNVDIQILKANGENIMGCGDSNISKANSTKTFEPSTNYLNDDEALYVYVSIYTPEECSISPEGFVDYELSCDIDITAGMTADKLCQHYRMVENSMDETLEDIIPEDQICQDDEQRQQWYGDNTQNYQKATTKANGYTGDVICGQCGKVIKKGSVISYAKTATPAKSSVAYTGKAITNAITVKNAAGKVISADNYEVTYSDKINIGTVKVTVTFHEDSDYEGTLTTSYSIVPKTTTGLSLTAASKGFTAKWTKDSAVTGYEVQYATASSFKSAKTVSITKNSTVTAKVTKLTASKKYYVRVRSYKTVGKTKVYSAWSAAKTVTTKK